MTDDTGAGAQRDHVRLRRMRRVAIMYFAAYAILVTWPGVVPFRNARPFVLGLPFPLVWVTLWIIGAFVVLVLLERAYRHTDDTDTSTEPRG